MEFYTVVLRQSASNWVAFCLENGQVGQGDTPEDAISKLEDAIDSFQDVNASETIYTESVSIKDLHEFLIVGSNNSDSETYELRKVYFPKKTKNKEKKTRKDIKHISALKPRELVKLLEERSCTCYAEGRGSHQLYTSDLVNKRKVVSIDMGLREMSPAYVLRIFRQLGTTIPASKIFTPAITRMVEDLIQRTEHTGSDIEKSFGLNRKGETFRDFKKNNTAFQIDNLEKILLCAPVDEKALKIFIEEIIQLFEYYKNMPLNSLKKIIVNEPSELEEPLSTSYEDMHYRKSQGKIIFEPSISNIETAELLRQDSYRIGQQIFSDNVCSNYSNRCCFPDCPIDECTFLIGAHIARWADVEELRGDLSNGLCLCLMHDKAFEAGFFTLTEDFRVAVNKNNQTAMTSKWCKKNLIPYDGDSISFGSLKPSVEALRHHWARIGFTPDS
jgi:predicted restriction endonuclease/predicted RNase H-like HicB family nuclease